VIAIIVMVIKIRAIIVKSFLNLAEFKFLKLCGTRKADDNTVINSKRLAEE